MKFTLITFTILLGTTGLFAQAPDTVWTKTYEGHFDGRKGPVQQTIDGGYIIAGYIQSSGSDGKDVYLIKTDSLGDTLWTKTFGEDSNEIGYSVQQTTDGGYIITGKREGRYHSPDSFNYHDLMYIL